MSTSARVRQLLQSTVQQETSVTFLVQGFRDLVAALAAVNQLQTDYASGALSWRGLYFG